MAIEFLIKRTDQHKQEQQTRNEEQMVWWKGERKTNIKTGKYVEKWQGTIANYKLYKVEKYVKKWISHSGKKD